MAGHSQFKNIMHRKGAQDKKRAKIFTKVVREIITAVKDGQADPIFNPRLRSAIAAAKAVNLPKDKIDQAIKRGSNNDSGDNYEAIRYEGYAPGGAAVIVEALTDNRNRTASEVRASFTKAGGQLGEMNSVAFMFDRLGEIIYPTNIATEEQMLEAIIEAGADDQQLIEDYYVIYCAADQLHQTATKLADSYGEADSTRLVWRAKNTVELSAEQAEKLAQMIDILEDLDDVQHVWTNH